MFRIGKSKCVGVGASFVSGSLQRHGLWPTRFLCPWNFPSKNPKGGCHFLLPGVFPKGSEPVSPALAGRFFTTAPLGKSRQVHRDKIMFSRACREAEVWINYMRFLLGMMKILRN